MLISALFAWAGSLITVIGWTDLLLLWYPWHFGEAQWEFGTISAHFDGMALLTIGLILTCAGGLGRGWFWRARALSILCFVISIASLSITVIYLLDIPVALNATAPALHPTLRKAIVKTGVCAVAYIALYGGLTRFLWRYAGTELTSTNSPR